MTDFPSSPVTETPVCCYCDAALSCACCGREQPADVAPTGKQRIAAPSNDQLKQIETLRKENDALRAKVEELDKRDYIISSNRNSFM